MANFSYQAINESGTTISGVIQAESVENAENLLLSKGYIPSKVAATRRGSSASLLEKIDQALGHVKITDLILFSKQFRSMMQAGVPILRLLTVLENQTENRALRRTVAAIGQDITGGSTLHDAMKKHPRVFSPLYLSMINAGEISGTIPDVLERLIGIIEHEAKIKSDVRSALQYPIIVVIALCIAFFILLTFVIPKFVGIFTAAKLTLPLPTKIAMLLHHFLIGYWFIVLAAVIGVIVGLHLWFKTDAGRLSRDAFILKLPLFGPVLQKAALSRFASIFAILQTSGVPVMQSLEILSGTIGNEAIARQFDAVREKVKEGQGISGPLGSAKYFTPMVIDMIAIGEESGNIDEMLRQISIHYDDEVSYAVKQLTTALGPILIVGLAIVVGFFAMAIFLPMWDMTKMTRMK
jgi:type II secretory pathway component PulF